MRWSHLSVIHSGVTTLKSRRLWILLLGSAVATMCVTTVFIRYCSYRPPCSMIRRRSSSDDGSVYGTSSWFIMRLKTEPFISRYPIGHFPLFALLYKVLCFRLLSMAISRSMFCSYVKCSCCICVCVGGQGGGGGGGLFVCLFYVCVFVVVVSFTVALFSTTERVWHGGKVQQK